MAMVVATPLPLATTKFIIASQQQQPPSPHPQHLHQDCFHANTISERGVQFSIGNSFFRSESSIGRDLAVLAAALYKKQHGRLRVIDALCGCGVRAVRYMVQSQADFVLANDANASLRPTIIENLSRYAPAVSSLHLSESLIRSGSQVEEFPCLEGPGIEDGEMGILGTMQREQSLGMHATCEQNQTEQSKWRVSHEEGNKLLSSCSLRKDFYDMIDVDSFGSESFLIGAALSAIRYGGLLYLTSTDWLSAGGRSPHSALVAYGAYIKPLPYPNEVGLRMLIGGAVREAAVRKMNVWPVFSLYSSHGPVFRVLLRVSPGHDSVTKHYGFIGYCTKCGDSKVVSWETLGETACLCSEQKACHSLKISGPLWTGPLHTGKDIKEMSDLAREWGWFYDWKERDSSRVQAGSSSSVFGNSRNIQLLLELMLEESHPELSPGYICLDEIAKRAKISTPPRSELIHFLKNEGYVVSRSHIRASALKINCSLSQCITSTRKMASTDL